MAEHEWLTPYVAHNWGDRQTYLLSVAPDELPKDTRVWDVLKQRHIRLEPLTPDGSLATLRGVPVAVPHRLWVRWPDGSDELALVEWRKYRDKERDHGHTYDVEGYEPWLVVEHHGARLAIKLADAGVTVRWPQ